MDIYSLLRESKNVGMQFSGYVALRALENSPLLFSLSCGPANMLSDLSNEQLVNKQVHSPEDMA